MSARQTSLGLLLGMIASGQIVATGATLRYTIVERDSQSADYVATPGEIVVYEIRGIADTGVDNDGLALWGANLSFLNAAIREDNLLLSRPLDETMNSFVLVGPQGYGGVPIGNSLVQIGGGQDPNGSVDLHLAEPLIDGGLGEQVLAIGAYEIPFIASNGTGYALELNSSFANAWSEGWSNPLDGVTELLVDQSDAFLVIIAGVADCNSNGVPDAQDISSGASADCDLNGRPDDCELDCNSNGIVDACDVGAGTSADVDGDGILDQCIPPLDGDCDFDGDVDSTDYSDMSMCFAGPGGGLVDPTCACFDFDGNESVDLRDYARFQENFAKKRGYSCYDKKDCAAGSRLGAVTTKADCKALGGKAVRKGVFGSCENL